MGIAVGELITDGAQFYGDAVNLAARIRATVPPGSVGLSGDAYVWLDEPEESFESLGPRKFKNIPDLVRVYVFHGDRAVSPGNPERRPVRSGARVAFTTVKPMGGDVDHVAEILTRELRTGLIRLPGLELVAPPTRPDAPPREISVPDTCSTCTSTSSTAPSGCMSSCSRSIVGCPSGPTGTSSGPTSWVTISTR